VIFTNIFQIKTREIAREVYNFILISSKSFNIFKFDDKNKNKHCIYEHIV